MNHKDFDLFQDWKEGFPYLLEVFRLRLRWSRAQVAKRAKFDPSAVTRWENGSRNPPTPENIVRLARALGLSLLEETAFLASAGFMGNEKEVLRLLLDNDLLMRAHKVLNEGSPEAREYLKSRLKVLIDYTDTHY